MSDTPTTAPPLPAEPRSERLEAQLNGVMNCLANSLQEVERLKAGRFTPEEFQNLCHNFGEDDKTAFLKGCTEYQQKLFGTDVWEQAIAIVKQQRKASRSSRNPPSINHEHNTAIDQIVEALEAARDAQEGKEL